jgi:hypothetical protein
MEAKRFDSLLKMAAAGDLGGECCGDSLAGRWGWERLAPWMRRQRKRRRFNNASIRAPTVSR